MEAAKSRRTLLSSVLTVVLLSLGAWLLTAAGPLGVSAQQGGPPENVPPDHAASGGGAPGNGNVAPEFQVDPFWPKPLPNDWKLGQVAGVDVASDDTIWIVQRPRTLDEGSELIYADPAPPVMQFDQEGNFLQAWGPVDGPEGVPEDAEYEWFDNEHGLWLDDDDNVWLAGNGGDDYHVLKFTSDGTFLQQIGEKGVTGGNTDTEHLGHPAEGSVHDGEVYIADGYLNNRVIVFDAETGEYQRHWGAYGEDPPEIGEDEAPFDDAEAEHFGNPVHCAETTEDDLVYVCDRTNNRVQVFETDGTFVSEFTVDRGDPGLGAAWDVGFSPDALQTFLYNADGSNQHVDVLLRSTEEQLADFGRGGEYAGQFHWVHNLRTDSDGNLYTAEVSTGKRVQKFDLRGYRPVD